MTYRTLAIVVLLILAGCATYEVSVFDTVYQPTPLVIGEETTPPQGCIEHRERGGDLC